MEARLARAVARATLEMPSIVAAEAEVSWRAIEVIGDKREAMRWLGTPVRALDYATPISLLCEAEGRAEVLRVLGRMEHGVL